MLLTLIIAGLTLLALAGVVSAAVNFSLKVTETLSTSDAPLIDTADAAVRMKIEKLITLNAGSTPDGELHADMSVAMTAGAATIDFTALTKRGGVAQSFNGKKVRAIAFYNPVANANIITISEGASNGLPLFGATFKIGIQPGDYVFAYLGDAGTAVGGTDKNIDLAGTGTQALQMLAVAG